MVRWGLFLAFGALLAHGQTRLLRQPAYHQGRVAFSHQGDLWIANDDGTGVKRLTHHRLREINPRFSPDGKWIAFSSNRMGGYDVFVMPTAGGDAKQLTFHSAADNVVGWTPDGAKILFTSARGNGAFPTVANLYEVSSGGGPEQMVPTDWGSWGSYSPDGKRLAYTRHPANWTRKHYRGSYAADLWLLDVAAKSSRPLTDAEYKGNMMFPMYGAKGEIFFLADRLPAEKGIAYGGPEVMKSTLNLWKVSERGGRWEQVTRHASGMMAAPSISADGKVIVYEENHGLWKLDTASGKTTEIRISIVTDAKDNELEWKTLASTADSYSLSPSGKRAAISGQGEIFTVATDRGEPQRVTASQRRDTGPVWSPNGKWIAYTSDESGREEIWVSDEMGKNRRKLTDSEPEKRGIAWANDSKSLLYAMSDNTLMRLDVETSKSTEVARSETTGIQSFRFSPDDQWISFSRNSRDMRPRVYVKPASGGEEKVIGMDELFSARQAVWSPDGKKLILVAGVSQQGMASVGRPSSLQLYSVALQKEEKNPLDRGIDSEEEAAAASPSTPAGPNRGSAGPPAKVEVKIDWDGLPKRIRQITRQSDSIGAAAVSPDSRQIAYVSAAQEDGRFVSSLWVVQENGERATRLAQSQPPPAGDGPPGPGRGFGGGAINSPQWTKDGRTLFFMDGEGIYSVSVPPPSDGPGPGGGAGPGGGPASVTAGAGGGSGTPTRKRVNFNLRVEVDHEALRAQVFDEGWRIMKNRFYDPKMHGVNWANAKDTYASLLPYVSDTEELQTVMMEMIGELNASHTGVSGGAPQDRSLPQTRSPGFEADADSSGFYRVSHIYKKGPADKDFLKLAKGNYILALNGRDLKTTDNLWESLTRDTASRWEFLVNDKPSRDGAWKIEIEPASGTAYSNLMYERWVEDRKEMVTRLTNGEIGYLHIRAMDQPSLRKFELDLADAKFKKALIIDQRFNGGGGIDQELLQILAQRMYQKTQFRGSILEERPQRAFFGPMVVMQNERSASDAEMFPDGFRALGLGKLVGVPTLGAVIGTGAAQLMDGSSIRTPGVGVYTAKGQNLENYGVPPDVYVDNTPDDFVKGRDAQIEKAIEVLKGEMGKK